MHRKNVGYGPSRLAIAGLGCSITGLLLPVLSIDPTIGVSLLTLGGWLLAVAYVWYTLNIYDLRKKEPRITALLMITIPISVYWVGGQFLEMLAGDPWGAVILLVPALAVGAVVSLVGLWLLSTLRRGTLRLFNKHERRRRWPSMPWVVGCILVVSLYSLSSTAAFTAMGDPAAITRSIAEDFKLPDLPHDSGIAESTTRSPINIVTTTRQAIPAPSRVTNPPITIAYIPTPARQSSIDTGAIEQAVFALTNQERQAQGLPALQWDAALASIARAHSQDMAENNYVSHTNKRGQDATARAAAAGYPIRRDMGGGYTRVGLAENIAWQPTGNVIGQGYVNNDPQSVARAMMQGWMNSEGHRKNILDRQSVRLGVGVAYDGSLYYYGTQDFI